MDRRVAETRKRATPRRCSAGGARSPSWPRRNYRVRQAAERQAMNAGIQGLAADIFKVALVRLDAALEGAGAESRLVLQVHDEVILEVPPAERDQVTDLTVTTMQGAADLPCRSRSTWRSATAWASAKS